MPVLQNQTNRKTVKKILVQHTSFNFFVHYIYIVFIYKFVSSMFNILVFFVLSSDKYFYIFEILCNLYHPMDMIIKKDVIFLFVRESLKNFSLCKRKKLFFLKRHLFYPGKLTRTKEIFFLNRDLFRKKKLFYLF